MQVTDCLLAVIGCLLVVFIVLERFAELERKDAEAQVQRLRDVLHDSLEAQRSVALQWSNWDDAYRFVQQPNPEFIAVNLVASSLRDSRVDTIAYLDFSGRQLGDVTTRRNGALPANFLGHLPTLSSDVRQGKPQVGFVAIDGAVYEVVALPVVDSDDTKGIEPQGICVMLRELTPDVVQALTRSLQVSVSFSPAAAGLGEAAADKVSIEAVDTDRLRCRITINGLDGRGVAAALIELPRPVNALARRTMRELLVAGTIALGTVATLLLLLLEGSVLRRISRLGREVAAQEKDPSLRITIDGRDEIAYLAGVVERTVIRQRESAKRAELSQQRYLLLFQRSADAIMVIDGDVIIDVNRAAARMFGAPSRKSLMETAFSRLTDGSTRATGHRGVSGPGSSDTRPAQVSPVVRTATDRLSQWTMYALDGRQIQAEVREAALELDGREAIQLLIRDVTERYKAEAERRLLASLVEATTDCVVVADGRGRTVFINQAARLMLGVPEDEDVSQVPVQHFFAPETRSEQMDVAWPWARTNGVWRGETELVARDGRTVPASQVLVAVTDEAEQVTHLGSLLRDITVERERERQLDQARCMAEDAVHAKSNFLAVMSHELRTPLNGVIGMSSLLQEAELPKEHRELVDTIKLCADNLLALINDILDLSKIEAGGLEFESIQFNLREVVESAVMIVSEPALAKGLEIGSIVASGVPELVIGDPNRLRQVLVNLLGNAVKFTDQGEVVISVGHQPRNEGDAADSLRLSFSIRDSGIGIAPDVLRRLFKPFVQADNTTTRRHGGTGLGLAISQRLVSFMGGSITVSSVPGQGSVFAFGLALAVVRSASTQEAGVFDLSHTTVLVADNNLVSRQLTCAMLATWGAQVIEVPSIQKADEAVRSGRIALALTVQQLADGDAADLVRVLRAGREGRQVPIALLVPAFLRKKEELLAASGADELVIKPLRSSLFQQSLQSMLDDSAVRQLIPQPTLSEPGIAGKRVLIVEDNATNRLLAMRILEVLGLQCSTVISGAEALDTLAVETFDLVLMDCQMPDLDGLEATRLFREREARETALMRRVTAGHVHSRAVIIAVTAFAMAGDRERCLAAGMDDYMAKPYTINDLRLMLEKWIGR